MEKQKKHMKIGLLEDNPNILELMQAILEMKGHTLFSHTTGQSLLETLQAHSAEQGKRTSLPYDLLIVDLSLPGGMSGLDVITAIYQLIAPDILPIIVVSGGGLSELEQVHARFPAIPIVRKPFPLQTLLQLIATSNRTQGTSDAT